MQLKEKYVTTLEKSKRSAILDIDLCLRQLQTIVAFLYFFVRLSLHVHCVSRSRSKRKQLLVFSRKIHCRVWTAKKKQEPRFGKLFDLVYFLEIIRPFITSKTTSSRAAVSTSWNRFRSKISRITRCNVLIRTWYLVIL